MAASFENKVKAYMLYLRGTGMNNRQIAKKIGCGAMTVQKYIGKSPYGQHGNPHWAKWNIPDVLPGMEQERKPELEPEQKYVISVKAV